MSLLNYQKITITRRDTGKYINGFYVKGPNNFVIDSFASIQPLTGLEAQQLSEGDKLKDWQRIYCKNEIQPNDVIKLENGFEYEVRRIEGWRHIINGGLIHSKGYITRLNT